MFFERVQAHNFRVYELLTLELAPGVNILVGPNAAGKSSALEALSVLATGRSFRGAGDPELARTGEAGYRLSGRFTGRLGSHTIEVIYARGDEANPARKASALDGRALPRASDVLGRVPLMSFSPDDLALVKGGPAGRRRFLDILLAQTSAAYRDHLARYGRTLAQRNALLADLCARRVTAAAADTLLEPWNEALAAVASAIQAARGEAVAALGAPATAAFGAVDGRGLGLDYRPDVFDPGRKREELRRGVTLSGPHRDELALAVDGQDARRFASQGQQRSLVLALKLAALEVLERRVGESPILLLDDVMSELDPRRGASLLPLLLRGQALVTATDRAGLERALSAGGVSGAVAAWFEVTRGSVVQVNGEGGEGRP